MLVCVARLPHIGKFDGAPIVKFSNVVGHLVQRLANDTSELIRRIGAFIEDRENFNSDAVTKGVAEHFLDGLPALPSPYGRPSHDPGSPQSIYSCYSIPAE